MVLVAGHEGSGKHVFASCHKQSFLESLPVMPLYQGIISGMSFVAFSTLEDANEIALLRRAKMAGYKINAYFLASGRLLALMRLRLKKIVDGDAFSERDFKTRYDASYSGMIAAYEFLDIVFLIQNQKEFRFIAAFNPQNVDRKRFASALKRLKSSVDALK